MLFPGLLQQRGSIFVDVQGIQPERDEEVGLLSGVRGTPLDPDPHTIVVDVRFAIEQWPEDRPSRVGRKVIEDQLQRLLDDLTLEPGHLIGPILLGYDAWRALVLGILDLVDRGDLQAVRLLSRDRRAVGGHDAALEERAAHDLQPGQLELRLPLDTREREPDRAHVPQVRVSERLVRRHQRQAELTEARQRIAAPRHLVARVG